MNISIISPGKFKKKPPLEELFNYYKKRINLKIDLKEIKTFNFEEKKKLLFEKNQITKQNLKTQKTAEKFYSILSEVEKLKRDKKNKK